MKKRNNVINYLFTICITFILFFSTLLKSSEEYGGEISSWILKFFVGVVVAGFLCALFHEVGHLIAGKKNGFVFSSIAVWFFRLKKDGEKLKFSFIMIGEQAGYTEMIPSSDQDLDKKLVNMTKGGLIASFIVMLLGLPALYLTDYLSAWAFSIWSMLLTMGAYYFFGTALPASDQHSLNDGAVIYSIKKQTDVSKVMLNLLKIQANLYVGKRPSEIDEKLYFDLPQLREDDVNFALLLNARYQYYLDKQDYENAQKCSERLLTLEDYLPTAYMTIFKIDALYNACTFARDEDKADDIMYELDRYINSVNDSQTLRAKLAYLLNVRQERNGADMFFNKAYKEANKCQLKGLGLMEAKLLDGLKEQIDKN